ncbi:flagellar protein FlgN [Deefgea piscis]|uniref:Flagellar protein FlgN n=1 Tax=Deefgea piscis TaxID=2739061 RepID=A0A6M8SVA1_9NEIS|nr:flagellar protein FlgN [Deefgea piscis]QKJ67988.1 flagellar protein FlgN [Deefgea piscis]
MMSICDLNQAITIELLEVERLVALMQREQDILTTRQFDQINDLLILKTRAVQQLEIATQSRMQCARQLNLHTASQMNDYLSVDSKIAPQWRHLQQQAKLAEVLNRSNAQLVQCHEDANRHLLSLLSQEKNQEIAYSANGRLRHQQTLGRPLDRA